MKALNVKPPWSALIASGEKPFEVRSWRTKYRGPLVIVSSARPDMRPLAAHHRELALATPRGVSLCVVDLVDIIEGKPEHANRTGGVDPSGQYCWVLENPRPCVQHPIQGRLNVWDWPDEIELFNGAGAPPPA